ncbi:hypothetical protein SAY87_014502 [Trapa incisa]|uniref:Probable zinc-ribbon domain-containing protein n=1 Tax=Trapa incisa TaxID=236973 RepID=A0AAN7GNR3_9MYRT|nr:hypothetical protein SAY87_014502 [Trapa incisa]
MEKRYASLDGGRNPRKWGGGSRLSERSMNSESAGYLVNHRPMVKDPINSRPGGDVGEINLQIYELINHLKSSSMGGLRETSQFKDLDGLLNSRSSRSGNDQWDMGGDWFKVFSRNLHDPHNRAPPSFSYGRSTESHHDAYRSNSFENLEMDRAELMRKLEQLNYLIRKSKEAEQRLPINEHVVPSDHYNARFDHYDGLVSSTNRYKMEVPSPSILSRNFHDPSGNRVIGSTGKHTHLSEDGDFVKVRMEYACPEPYEVYTRDPFPPTHPLGSRKPLEETVDPVRVTAVDYNPVVFGSNDRSHPLESQSRNSGSLRKAHSRTDLDKSRTHLTAIAGGAPFIICSNCFNLLRLPRLLRIKEKDRDKARCGSCSAAIHFKQEENRLITSCTISEDSQEETNNEGLPAVVNTESITQSSSTGLSDNFRLNSFVDTEHDFSLAKSEENSFSREEGVDVSRREKIPVSISVISSSEEYKEVERKGKVRPKKVIIERDDHTSPVHVGSPLEKKPQNFASDVAYESQLKSGKNSDNIGHEEAFLQKRYFPRVSFKDSVTEVDVSASEYPITSMSQDSVDTSREEYQPRNKKGGGRSFGEQSMSETILENERSEVTVNGHHIPEEVVKQAEVLAGPIHPGDYWYDYCSGFWGVMKYPCLGIIPPSIEAFNFPLPTNCSRGDTGIFVNSRQLHKHDLKLLARRGLPVTRNQFYIIDISGQVIDEDTGEKLYDLGKLAPTVLKEGRGFGMRVPRSLRCD